MGRRAAPPIQAAIGLIERRGRYLICQRRADDFLGGLWEFPGGTRDPDESWEACLRRELREELGIAVRAIRRFRTTRYRYGDRLITFKVFRCVVARGRPRPREAQALRWVPPGRLGRYHFPPANQRLIACLAASCYNKKQRRNRRERR